MPAMLIVVLRFVRAIWGGLREPEFRALFSAVAVLVAIGTWFFARMEGWAWYDALYFTVITLTTVGYGDLTPTTPLSKLFTVVYILLGLGAFSTFILLLAERVRKQRPGIGRERQPKDEQST